jgi:protein TonB
MAGAMARLPRWTAPALLTLTVLSGCATTSARPPPPEPVPPPARTQEVKPAAEAPAPKRVRRERESPPKESARVVEAPKAPPQPERDTQTPLTVLTAELVCRSEGQFELRAPSERPADVLPFNPKTMSAPERLSGGKPQYTREALAKSIQGVSIVRCILNRDGAMRSCRILKSVPHMDEAVVSALCASRHAPATLNGKLIDVEHTFTTRLEVP